MLHQAVHSADTDADAIVTLQDIFGLVGAESFIIVCVGLIKRKERIPWDVRV